MAVLSNIDRADVSADFQRSETGTFSLTKADIRAAVDALDAWFDTNAATLNIAIPQPARAQLSAAQKARLLTIVIRQRYLKGA